MITLKKTEEQLENEKKLGFLKNHHDFSYFLEDFYDETMLTEILTERVNESDKVTVKALNEFIEKNEEEYEQWKVDQNDTRPDTNEEREER
jgi:ABC-type Zn uptake system ZnuABC Zn-binding protein ZnuA